MSNSRKNRKIRNYLKTHPEAKRVLARRTYHRVKNLQLRRATNLARVFSKAGAQSNDREEMIIDVSKR